MSFDVPVHFSEQYTTNVQMLLQQRGSKLRNIVNVMSGIKGKNAVVVEQIGPVSAQEQLTRHGDTPLISTPGDKRWIAPKKFNWADLIDDEDKLQMLIDPTSSYALNGAYAMGRAMDDCVIDALFGTAMTGENGSTSTAFATATQQVAVTVGGAAATGLNVAKLRAAKKILLANEVDMDMDPIYCLITATQHDNLLAETQVTSLDFNERPVLADGKITRFMGINFVDIQRLGVDSSSYRRVPIFAKSGVTLGIWNDINTSIEKRADKNDAMQVLVKGMFNATRTDEKKVVEVLCSES